jgi:hypothetical protein
MTNSQKVGETAALRRVNTHWTSEALENTQFGQSPLPILLAMVLICGFQGPRMM